MKMCLNRNVLIGLGAVALGIWVLAPSAFSAALPALVLLACPLSIAVIMWAMSRGRGGDQCVMGSGRSSATDVDGPDAAPTGKTADEVVRLRAEVDQLRAELAAKRTAESAGETTTAQPSA